MESGQEHMDDWNGEDWAQRGLLVAVGGRGGNSYIPHFSVLPRKYFLSFCRMMRLSSLKKDLASCCISAVPDPLRSQASLGIQRPACHRAKQRPGKQFEYIENWEYGTSSLFKFEDKMDFVCFQNLLPYPRQASGKKLIPPTSNQKYGKAFRQVPLAT